MRLVILAGLTGLLFAGFTPSASADGQKVVRKVEAPAPLTPRGHPAPREDGYVYEYSYSDADVVYVERHPSHRRVVRTEVHPAHPPVREVRRVVVKRVVEPMPVQVVSSGCCCSCCGQQAQVVYVEPGSMKGSWDGGVGSGIGSSYYSSGGGTVIVTSSARAYSSASAYSGARYTQTRQVKPPKHIPRPTPCCGK